jgi:hypothetical protein
MNMNEYILDFPSQIGTTPFRHIMINWNPNGHEPAGIYDKPHFDFHFYTISSEQRQQILPWEQDSMKFKNLPAPAYFPANYMYFGGGIPQMGAHVVDVTSPELHGQPFTETFFYGSFNGAIIFLEPMIELNTFMQAQVNRAVPRPEKVAQSGLYPRHYQVVKEPNSYSIVFDDFEMRNGQ